MGGARRRIRALVQQRNEQGLSKTAQRIHFRERPRLNSDFSPNIDPSLSFPVTFHKWPLSPNP
jgi:hypothetical protein